MTDLKSYFTLNEIALLSLCGALIFVLKVILKIPLHISGHSGIFWLIPAVIGVGIVRKPGSGTYIGLISGILASFFGIGAIPFLGIFRYLAMGIAVDVTSYFFGYHLDNLAIGFITGAVANLVKMIVNYAVDIIFGVPATFILIGIGLSSVTHIIFGGLGGLLAALVIQRLTRAGVICEDPD